MNVSNVNPQEGREETEALFTAKPFHWASFSALKAPSELIHFISAKAPGETDEMLELKGNL